MPMLSSFRVRAPGVLLLLIITLGAPLWSGGVVSSASAGELIARLPDSVNLQPQFEAWGLPMRSQGSRSTCSVFAMTGAIEYALASERGTGTVLSVEFLDWAANQSRSSQRDGGFFSELWNGFQAHGICAETNLPYRTDYDPNLQPGTNVLNLAAGAVHAHLQLSWIKPWNVKTGLTETEFQEIKRTLASGWPVCAGFRWPKQESWRQNVLQMAALPDVFDGHSVLLVGFRADSAQPGGGVFLVRNSGGGPRIGAVPYEYARDYINDAVWISVPKLMAPSPK